ncbi:MAG: PHP domain-containing protein, partial [Oscillospiraceae bacterium]|nr:PHP domain-containing protein [Oscillospiraceae bacterium]
DLHCHTKISDGSLGIEEVMALAKRRKLSAVAITDHDSTAGATRGVIIGKRMDLPVIHAVEFSTTDTARGRNAHLICYLCNIPDRLEGVCKRNIESRKKTVAEQIKRVMRYYPISVEMILKCAAGSANVYDKHIMHALVDGGYADGLFGTTYQKLFGPGGSAYAYPEYTDTREVLDIIHSAGGVAVLAHPYEEDTDKTAGASSGVSGASSTSQASAEALMEEMVSLGLDGIEVWSPCHSEQQTAQLIEFARDNRLLMTGGSNFHGMYAPNPRPIGSVTVENEVVQELLNFKTAHKR